MSPDLPQQVAVQEQIVAVVVTYNRLHLLKKTLAGLEAGSLRPQTVVIVDNASSDGTGDYLAQLETPLNLDLVTLSKNLGGAGGFTVGIDRALARHQADLVWVMDDDTEPTESTLLEAYRVWASYSPVRAHRPAVVASKVVWTDGRDHPMNTMRTMFAAGAQRQARAQSLGARPIRSASFVSILMDGAAMRATDLPLADFFIWNDDFEYTTRLIQHSQGLATDRSVALHHTQTFGTTDASPGPRFYNDVRNKLWVFCGRRTLNPLEKVLYGGSTARLWVSTLLRTPDKRTYLTYFIEGLRDALKGWRPNEEVLAGVYELETPQLARQKREAEHSSDFTVLMSVYAADSPRALAEALRSNTQDQTLPPSLLLLVEDGPLTPALEEVISEHVASCPIPTRRLQLQQNVGLAAALREGLAACPSQLVARADADDISLPTRFERQIPLLAAGRYDLLGSAMEEFGGEESGQPVIRQVPQEAEQIKKIFPSRNPFLHPTVVFRKEAVEAVGSYQPLEGAEDYWLWGRMLKAGYRLGNLPEPLVRYRVTEAYKKRGGLAALRQDLSIQRRLYTGGLTTAPQAAGNLLIRSLYRLAPQGLRVAAFRQMTARPSSPTSRKGTNA